MEQLESGDYLDPFQLPQRPSYRASSLSSAKRILGFLSSPLLALFVAILAWTIPNVTIQTVLRVFLGIIILSVIVVVVDYLRRWYGYVTSLERRSFSLRSVLLESAEIDGQLSMSRIRYSISAIANRSGTVHLVLPEASGLRVGSLLDVIATVTGDVWGTVEVRDILSGQALAVPFDRTQPEFWEHLEDRMKRDPSPPSGFHLEPFVDPKLRELLRLVSLERT